MCGNLLDDLDEATRNKVLELRCMEYPLVEATTPWARKVQMALTERGHFDIECGRFIRTKLIKGGGTYRLGPMGCIANTGYIHMYVANYKFQQSHLVHLWFTGTLPKSKEQMDHIDGCRANDRPQNLRLVSNLINSRNSKKRINNTSGFTGVGYDYKCNKYYSKIKINYKDVCLGFFSTAQEAHKNRQDYISAHPEFGFTARHGL